MCVAKEAGTVGPFSFGATLFLHSGIAMSTCTQIYCESGWYSWAVWRPTLRCRRRYVSRHSGIVMSTFTQMRGKRGWYSWAACVAKCSVLRKRWPFLSKKTLSILEFGARHPLPLQSGALFFPLLHRITAKEAGTVGPFWRPLATLFSTSAHFYSKRGWYSWAVLAPAGHLICNLYTRLLQNRGGYLWAVLATAGHLVVNVYAYVRQKRLAP